MCYHLSVKTIKRSAGRTATAAAAYRKLQGAAEQISRVVLLGPAHRVYLQGMAVPSVDAFSTPLGPIALDQGAIARACALPDVIISDEAHRLEHCLEVQLPFLQVVLGQFTLVPIVVGECRPQAVARVIDALWQEPDTLLVISTDLSHYHSYNEATRLDRATCAQILAGQPTLTGQQACGAHALNGLLASQHYQQLQLEQLALCNSGDTAGDTERVVGYGAFYAH